MAVVCKLGQRPVWDGIAVLSATTPPSAGSLMAHTDGWIQAHIGPAFRDAMREMLRRDLLQFDLDAPADELRPAPGLLQHTEPEAASRLRDARHALVARAANLPGTPPWGTWLALSAARASALLLDGVVVDPLTWTVPPLSWCAAPPTSHVPVSVGGYVGFTWEQVGEHIRLLTRGLSRVGLPELAADGLAPTDLHNARWILLGAAWVLIRKAVEEQDDTLHLDQIEVDAEAMLSAAVDPQTAARQATPAPLPLTLTRLDAHTLQVAPAGRPDTSVSDALRRASSTR